MIIRDKEIYAINLWDRGFLDDCFQPTKIKLSDVDGIVERNGRFLLIEAKSSDKQIPLGQKILFDRLVDTEKFTVLVLWGKPNQPEKMCVWPNAISQCTKEDVQEMVRTWFLNSMMQGSVN